ncbi:Aerobic glycerol-3-phosphate dehydrogenase [bacterium HR40]|nr:Aerobic glycerol-3-phosphate dehydrogenase [bacterium HR40]
MSERSFDLLVVGGGINGAGIARDAAGRGLSVLLVEQDDLAAHTSSRSSKLIHGGLRYLEHGEFRLVREALREREVLLANAPHLVRPLTFVLPHAADMRPAWLVRLGLFVYDHLGGRERLPRSRRVRLTAEDPFGAPLKPAFETGFLYADCWVDDARLVVLVARDAADRGARVRTRTRCIAARRGDGVFRVTLEDMRTGEREEVRARALVNATGPWVSHFLREVTHSQSRRDVRLVKGSHLVVPRLYEGQHAYILQNRDRRVVFVLPFADAFSLIGTTDVPVGDDPVAEEVSEAEVDYLLAAVARYWAKPPQRHDIVWRFAGVRPLYDDGIEDPSAVTRDYVLDLDAPPGEAPLLSVFGGKLTTFRRLAEHALARLTRVTPIPGRSWTADAPLPGGDIPGADFDRFLSEAISRLPEMPRDLLDRLARAYGTRLFALLAGAKRPEELGTHFGAGLYERELAWLAREEWAEIAEDVLWRRTKLGLHFAAAQVEAVEGWLADHVGPSAARQR